MPTVAVRSWLTSAQEADFDAKVADLCRLYQEAPALAERGERVLSTDEMTGVQALERKHPGLPMVPGKVERREFKTAVRNGHDAPIKIVIEDQVPVSEIDDVKVELLPTTTPPSALRPRVRVSRLLIIFFSRRKSSAYCTERSL